MTISNELLKAILAMDAYNRGYDAALKDSGSTTGLVGTAVGIATIGQNSTDKFGEGVDSAVGFYAASYTVGTETIISYRGTDTKSLGPGGDIWNGYGVARGSPYGEQAALAVKFYQTFRSGTNVQLA